MLAAVDRARAGEPSRRSRRLGRADAPDRARGAVVSRLPRRRQADAGGPWPLDDGDLRAFVRGAGARRRLRAAEPFPARGARACRHGRGHRRRRTERRRGECVDERNSASPAQSRLTTGGGRRRRARGSRLSGRQDEPDRRRRLAGGAPGDPGLLRGARFRSGLGRPGRPDAGGGLGARSPRPGGRGRPRSLRLRAAQGPARGRLARASGRDRGRHFGGGRRLCDAGERRPPRAGADFAVDLRSAGRGRPWPGARRGRRGGRSRRRARRLQSRAKGLPCAARPIVAAPRRTAARRAADSERAEPGDA